MSEQDPLVVGCQARVGQVVNGKYRLDALIGVGGMAAVYMATHRNGSVAALKVLHEEFAGSTEIRERFLREAYIANKVGHDGTVKVLDDDIDEAGAPYLVMELLQGRPLDAVAARSGDRLPLPKALAAVDETLSVLEAAHAVGIIHRDLKPENLFETNSGSIKVLDFGIARLREENARRTQTGMVMGTPSFMAPEQAMGRWDQVDARTDLYAVGATLFTLLSGRPVHEAETAGEMLVAAATRPARSLSSVLPNAPLSLVAMVDKALSYEREQRFTSATEFRAALAELRVQLTPAAPAEKADEDGPATGEVGVPAAGRPSWQAVQSSRRPANFELLIDGLDPSQQSPAEQQALEETFLHFDRALKAISQYGKDHPETRRRFGETFRALARGLSACNDFLAFSLTPYGFAIRDTLIWEPETPWNRVPYQLFADGVRTMAFAPGLDDEEFAEWTRIVTLDPVHDIAPEDDLVTRLWDADLQFAFYHAIDSFAEGDMDERARFEQEKRDIVDHAHRPDDSKLGESFRERKANLSHERAHDQARAAAVMAAVGSGPVDQASAARAKNLGVSAGEELGAATERATRQLDGATRTLLSARFAPSEEVVSERFMRAAAEAFVAATDESHAQQLGAPMRRSIENLVRGRSPEKGLRLLQAMAGAVQQLAPPERKAALVESVARQLLSEESLTGILEAAQSGTEREARVAAEDISELMGWLSESHVNVLLTSLPSFEGGPALDAALKFLRRFAAGKEGEIGALFADASLSLGLALVRLLVAVGTEASKGAIVSATHSPHPLVRIEALGHLEGVSGVRLQQELRNLLTDKDATVRLAALKAMEEHGMAAAGPFLVTRTQSRDFSRLPVDERRQSLRTLKALRPGRCEEVCIELLDDARLLKSDNHELTRSLAASMLGELASTNEAFFALERASKGSGLRNSRAVKDAASAALLRITERAESAIKRTRTSRNARTTRRTANTRSSTMAPDARTSMGGSAGRGSARPPGPEGPAKGEKAS